MSYTQSRSDTSTQKCALCDRPAVKDIGYAITAARQNLSEPNEMQIMAICKEHAAELEMLGEQAFFDRHPAN